MKFSIPVFRPLFFLLLFGVWTVLVFSGTLVHFDTAILVAMRTGPAGVPVGPSWLPDVVLGITHMGDSIILLFVSLAGVWLLWRMGGRQALTAGVFTFGGIFALTAILKAVFGRMRPDVIDHLTHASSASFPSGHALRSAVIWYLVFFLICKIKNKNYFTICYSFIFIIGFSRIYLGVHWPSDVVGSWLIAALWLSCVCPILDKYLKPYN